MTDAVGTITWAELGSPRQPGIYSGGGYNKVNVTAVNIAAAENNPAALCTIVEIAGEDSPAQYAIRTAVAASRQSVCSQSPRMGLLKNSMTFASRCGGNLEHERPCPTLVQRR
jgi:hypothetical protein